MFSCFPPESICSHEKWRINNQNTSFELLLFFFVGGRVYFLCCPDSSVAEYQLESVVVCNHLICVSDKLIVGTAALPRPVLSTH
jgi:hypothetical protein